MDALRHLVIQEQLGEGAVPQVDPKLMAALGMVPRFYMESLDKFAALDEHSKVALPFVELSKRGKDAAEVQDKLVILLDRLWLTLQNTSCEAVVVLHRGAMGVVRVENSDQFRAVVFVAVYAASRPEFSPSFPYQGVRGGPLDFYLDPK